MAVTPSAPDLIGRTKYLGAALPFSVLRSGFALATVAADFLTLCLQSGMARPGFAIER